MRRAPTRRRLPKLKTASRKRKIRRRKGKRRKILPAFPNKDRRQRDGKKYKRSEKGLFRSFCTFLLPNRFTSGHRYGAARERLRCFALGQQLAYARGAVSMYYNKDA